MLGNNGLEIYAPFCSRFIVDHMVDPRPAINQNAEF